MVKVTIEVESGDNRSVSIRTETGEESHDVHGLAWAISDALRGLCRTDTLEVLARAAENVIENHISPNEADAAATEAFEDACVAYFGFCEDQDNAHRREIEQRMKGIMAP